MGDGVTMWQVGSIPLAGIRKNQLERRFWGRPIASEQEPWRRASRLARISARVGRPRNALEAKGVRITAEWFQGLVF